MKHMEPCQTSQKGFTLVELMIVLAIVAIAMGLAAPNMQEALERNRRETIMTNFLSAVQTAKSEAARSNRPAVMCISNDGELCTTGSWADGWIMFVDRNNNWLATTSPVKQFEPGDGVDDDGEIVVSSDALLDNYELGPYASAGTSNKEFTEWMLFRPTGEMLGNNNGTSGGFGVCSPNSTSDNAKVFFINTLGQVRTVQNSWTISNTDTSTNPPTTTTASGVYVTCDGSNAPTP